MGCVPNILKGRTTARSMEFMNDRSGWSNSERSSLFPVSLRSRLVLSCSNLGGYVSFRKKRPKIWIAPSTKEVDQNTQRHVVFSAMKPPAIGPSAGPSEKERL